MDKALNKAFFGYNAFMVLAGGAILLTIAIATFVFSQDVERQSLETFRRIRAENHDLLKGLPETAFERTGNHTQNGPMTLLRLLEGYAGHAEAHARQVQAIREEFQRVKGKK